MKPPAPKVYLPSPVSKTTHPSPKKHAPVIHRGPPLSDIKDIPWQLVLAGGAAASGVVFAYKVGDGIQQGTIESARQAPIEQYMTS